MLRVYVFAKIGTTPQASIALTDWSIDVYRVNKDTQAASQLVAAAAMTREIGGGFYVYTLDTDETNFDLMAVVNYTGALALDIQRWVQTDASAVVQKGVTLLGFTAFARAADIAQAALALADFQVDVWRVTKSDSQPLAHVTNAAMTVNMGGGNYRYYLENQDFDTYDYLVVVDYVGAVALDETLWTGKPLGDIVGTASCGPSHRRTLPRTLLPLDRFAEIVGLDPRHFRQVTVEPIRASTSCAKVWKQYSWQESDQVGRYDIADAIQQAEKLFAQYLGYKLLPTWEVAERQQTPKPANPELFNFSNRDPRGFWLSARANWGHFVEGGIEAKSVIEPNAAVSYSDEDGDGYDETATVAVATSVTDEEEIAVFYPCEEGADEWEVRPLRDVSISGGIVTIKMWRHQLVQPDLIEAIDPQAVAGATDSNFLTTVDVYRRSNDPSQQVSLIWNPNLSCGCGTTTTTCCPICGQTTQDGCLMPKDYEASWLMYRPADWDAADEEFDSAILTCNRAPDQLQMWYRAGLRDRRRNWPHLQMDSQWGRAVAFYALYLLDRDICDCAPIKGVSNKWREDLARTTERGSSFQITDSIMDNPLGTSRAAQLAWNMIKEPGRRLALPARY